jgi:hypothetical protein
MGEFDPHAPVPIEDQVRCAERELGYRNRVYARWVSAGKMTASKAQAEIRAMTAVVATLKTVEQGGRLL